MQNINVFIKENVSKVAKKDIHLAPDIPEKKLNNAASSMKLQDNVGSIIALLDSTVFGSGKDGLAFTGKRMVYKPAFYPLKLLILMNKSQPNMFEIYQQMIKAKKKLKSSQK